MGHGASTNVKKLTITQSNRRSLSSDRLQHVQAAGTEEGARAPSPAKLGWTRSSSDGCIVENLNTSKTKVELLELQVEEFKELFHYAEEKANEAHARAQTLEQQMAEVEGANFELLDRVSELEQQLEASKDQTSPEAEQEFSRMLLERDQTIEKQVQQIKSLEEDLAKMRTKLRKKLRSAQTELAEAKQEAGLKVYSLKDQLAVLQEENAKLSERLERAHAISSAQSRQNSAATATCDDRIPRDMPTEEEWEDGRTKVILELSSQLSSQEQRIVELEETVREREETIQALQVQLRSTPRPPSGTRTKQSLAARSLSVEKQPEQLDDLSKQWTAGNDGKRQLSIRQQRTSSSSSSKGREGRRSSSTGRHPSSGKEQVMGGANDNLRNHELAAGGKKVRQHSANSVDSAISDRSDSSSTKASSASSSRERRRRRNQLSRQSSADERELQTRSRAPSDVQVEGRDSGIGVTSEGKSKYSDDVEQMMDDIVGNS
ncbi:centrosomal protein CEP57L1-like [Acanthaster planci]|uniref:Centrosomal protein CEP57L1-like n=1 Tax=Acanthaster planci TaxID=133434 RepID=A0A8B7ZZV8_ACAPL|nr:centrosomal protein CEP57L1-like [Acanthaster planci]